MAYKKAQQIVEYLFSQAGININGKNPYDITVLNNKFYNRILTDHALGLGESYMDGWWECNAIDQFIDRLLRAQLDKKVKGNWKILLHMLRSKIMNMQSFKRSYKVGEQHYDIGNDLYRKMLDKRLVYTCAYWKNAQTLDDAQEAKLDMVCKKINLKENMSILDLGCGWGSFAKFAAEKYGAHITGVTVSKAQAELGNELCNGLPVNIHLQDYRTVNGKYDRVISIGIMEHVGPKNYATYMNTVDRCLKDDGIAFIHTIGNNTSEHATNAWTDKYIFPNGCLPSIGNLGQAMEGLFVMEDWHNFGPDYDKTLMAWYHNFEKAWPELKNNYTDRFYRMWKFYLLICAGAFRARNIQLWQIVMSRPGSRQPECRI